MAQLDTQVLSERLHVDPKIVYEAVVLVGGELVQVTLSHDAVLYQARQAYRNKSGRSMDGGLVAKRRAGRAI